VIYFLNKEISRRLKETRGSLVSGTVLDDPPQRAVVTKPYSLINLLSYYPFISLSLTFHSSSFLLSLNPSCLQFSGNREPILKLNLFFFSFSLLILSTQEEN
jgi:hypothetical protein